MPFSVMEGDPKLLEVEVEEKEEEKKEEDSIVGAYKLLLLRCCMLLFGKNSARRRGMCYDTCPPLWWVEGFRIQKILV
jgi:hypothetical protein